MPAGSTSTIPGVWFEVHVLRHRRLLHVYQTVEAGRRLMPSLVWSSDSHYALRDVDRAGRVAAADAEAKEGAYVRSAFLCVVHFPIVVRLAL
jgi:hypothetical protein